MGTVHFGIPESESEWLRSNLNLTTLIEGGTYKGDTALRMSRSFDKVITMERSPIMFEVANKRLAGAGNVEQLQGDTRNLLPELLSVNDNILFWLDAHWSGGETYGRGDECPLIEELRIIFNSPLQNFAILIDDARLFLSPPPLPHALEQWPTIKVIAALVPDTFDMFIRDDVLYLVPSHIEMPSYIQSISSGGASWPGSLALKMKNLITKLLTALRAS